MKDFSIFVEGDSDKRFIEDYLFFLSEQDPQFILPEEWKKNIYKTNGWTNLNSAKNEAERNIMLRTTRQGGVNLVIFDADADAETRKAELEEVKANYGVEFETFLFPNNKDSGAIEELLEQVINPQNQCVIDCWKRYETDLSHQSITWKQPTSPTTPSSKSKIYAYLEALVGTTQSEKEKIKDRNRNFLNTDHWNLAANYLAALKDFLLANLMKK